MYYFFFDESAGPGAVTETHATNPFQSIKHVRDDGSEYWLARELQTVLTYGKWENFHKVILKAIDACKASENAVSLHFPDVRKIVKAGLLEKTIPDYELTRYACYLIAMNGDSRKQVIALAQTYFAVKTREQEITEQFNELSEDQKRLLIREDLKPNQIGSRKRHRVRGVVFVL